MIMGLGTDIVEIGRITRLIEKKGELGLKRLFTPNELAICGHAAHRLAGRFAAKEAFFKALGTGFRGFKWQEVEIQNDTLGAPYFRFSGRLQAHLEMNGVDKTHLTIAHSKEYAVAQVIMERVKV
jgi:holo-[acyl-carrier protein] synthase